MSSSTSNSNNTHNLELLYSIIASIIQNKKTTEIANINLNWSTEAIAAFTNLFSLHLSTILKLKFFGIQFII